MDSPAHEADGAREAGTAPARPPPRDSTRDSTRVRPVCAPWRQLHATALSHCSAVAPLTPTSHTAHAHLTQLTPTSHSSRPPLTQLTPTSHATLGVVGGDTPPPPLVALAPAVDSVLARAVAGSPQLLLVKAASEGDEIYRRGEFLIMLGTAISGPLQLTWLARGLRNVEAQLIIPTFASLFTICARAGAPTACSLGLPLYADVEGARTPGSPARPL